MRIQSSHHDIDRGLDIVDYGLAGCTVVAYLKAKPIREVKGIVTNPPYKLAVQFAEEALRETPYLALLLDKFSRKHSAIAILLQAPACQDLDFF